MNKDGDDYMGRSPVAFPRGTSILWAQKKV